MDGQSVHRGHLHISRTAQQVSAAIGDNENVSCLLFYHLGLWIKSIEGNWSQLCSDKMENANHCYLTPLNEGV